MKVRVRERPACAILIALSGVAVAPTPVAPTELSERRIAERVCVQKRPALAWANPEIEEWIGLNGNRRRNDVSPCPFLLVRWEPFTRATSV